MKSSSSDSASSMGTTLPQTASGGVVSLIRSVICPVWQAQTRSVKRTAIRKSTLFMARIICSVNASNWKILHHSHEISENLGFPMQCSTKKRHSKGVVVSVKGDTSNWSRGPRLVTASTTGLRSRSHIPKRPSSSPPDTPLHGSVGSCHEEDKARDIRPDWSKGLFRQQRKTRQVVPNRYDRRHRANVVLNYKMSPRTDLNCTCPSRTTSQEGWDLCPCSTICSSAYGDPPIPVMTRTTKNC